jgi:internalin A
MLRLRMTQQDRARLFGVGLICMFAFAGCGKQGANAPGQGANAPGVPFEEKLAKAWTEAGAEIGWMKQQKMGGHFTFYKRSDAEADLIPTFRFKQFPAGKLAQLPSPTIPFGLHLAHPPHTLGTDLKQSPQPSVTDADLKELSGFTQLRQLNLYDETKITDAGLKELAKLTQLENIDLSFIEITDAGLKHLGGLKSLRMLCLYGTKATDSGEKELEKAIPELKIIHQATGR